MQNASIVVKTDHLRAALLFAASKDVRYYLNGVYLESSETETRLTATDGHCLGSLRSDAVNGMGGRSFLDLIIPSAPIVSALKLLPKGETDVCVSLQDGRWTLEAGGAKLPFEPIDGRFPDYRRVLPNNIPDGKPAQFDPALLLRFAKAAVILKGKKGTALVHHHDAGSSALLTVSDFDDFAGVCMPIRTKPADFRRPHWMHTPLPGAEQAEAKAA